MKQLVHDLFFLLSSNFKISHIYKIILLFKKIFLSKEKKIKSDESLEKNNLINTNLVETRQQENLFNNYKKNNSINNFKIKLPLVDFLKKPEKLSNKKDEIKVDGESLEKIRIKSGFILVHWIISML